MILFVTRYVHSVSFDQGALVPAEMRSWLPPDHLAWQVIRVVRGLDLSRFHAAYRADGQGQAPYDPAMMLTAVYYCYLKRLTSSRELARACIDDVGCRVITGGLTPSNKAFSEFRNRHRAAIIQMFTQVLGRLKADGVITDEDETAAIDGSPASTAAALSSNVTRARLEEQIEQVQAEVDAAAAAWADANAGDGRQALWDDEDPGGPGPGGPGVPAGSGRKLAALHRKLARLKEARARAGDRAARPDAEAARSLARAAARAEKAAARVAAEEAAADAKMARYQQFLDAGKAWRYGTKPVPADRSARVARARKDAAAAGRRLAAAAERAAALAPVKISATDPGSRVLPGKNGGYLQGRSTQASAGRAQILYAIAIHDSPADAGALVPMVTATDDACDAAGITRIKNLLADCGYASEKNFTDLAASMHRLLVAVSKEAVQTGRRDPARPVPAPWHDMAARLAEPASRQLYKKRAAYVEPFFAQFFARFTRRIPFRGDDAILAELHLRGQAHNISKLITHHRRAAAQPATA
jgi:transposase